MANVIQNLKKKSIEFRKAKHPLAFSVTYVLSEIEKIGKNNGNRPTTDEEAEKYLQKLVPVIEQNLKLRSDAIAQMEVDFYKEFLPQMASEDDLEKFLFEAYGDKFSQIDIGSIMKEIKKKFGNTIDMKMASTYVKNYIG